MFCLIVASRKTPLFVYSEGAWKNFNKSRDSPHKIHIKRELTRNFWNATLIFIYNTRQFLTIKQLFCPKVELNLWWKWIMPETNLINNKRILYLIKWKQKSRSFPCFWHSGIYDTMIHGRHISYFLTKQIIIKKHTKIKKNNEMHKTKE